MKKKIFLTGATGKLGSTLTPYLEKKYNLFPVGFKIKPKGGVKIDLTQSINVKNILNKINPDIIIHLAAMTNVDYCDENSKKAFDVNYQTTKNMISWINYKKKECRFIYLSTDQIYDKTGFNKEDNKKAFFARNNYSKTKFSSEKAVLLAIKNGVIIRTNFYGFFPNHKDSLINWFLESLKKKKKIKLIKNIFFNPLHVHQLCSYLLKIIEKEKIKGIINLGAKNKISKGKLLFNISKKLNIKKKFTYENVENLNLVAYRPRNMAMCVDKIEKLLNKPMPTISKGIAELITNIKQNNVF